MEKAVGITFQFHIQEPSGFSYSIYRFSGFTLVTWLWIFRLEVGLTWPKEDLSKKYAEQLREEHGKED